MRRREFITGIGVTAAWALAARAQQRERMRRIGVLTPRDENDPEWKPRYSAFAQARADLGWIDGRNVRMDLRWAGGDINRIRALAQELVSLQPDIILANSTAVTAAFQRETRTIPIVMVNVTEPVDRGFVAAFNQPGGNITGFTTLEASLGGKWLELLSEIAPGLKRAAAMFNPDTAPVSSYMPSFETAAQSLKVEAITAPVHDDVEIETAIIALGREPRGGLVVMPDAFMQVHRAPIISAAARNNIPAVYFDPTLARDGGLLSYGPDQVDAFRRAAPYGDRLVELAARYALPTCYALREPVAAGGLMSYGPSITEAYRQVGIYAGRILKGEKPGDLPVIQSTKFDFVINLKTAKALGLDVPPTLLALTDEVIE